MDEYLEEFDLMEEPDTSYYEIMEKMYWLNNLLKPTVHSLKFYEMYYFN